VYTAAAVRCHQGGRPQRAQEKQFPINKRRCVPKEEKGIFSPYQTMEIEQEEPRVPTATEQQEFISMLPTEILWDILGRMGTADVSRARSVSTGFMNVSTDVLRTIETRTRNTICPDSAICDGSLFCAVASDDVQTVQNIVFAKRIMPRDKKVNNTEVTLMGGPCRVMGWEGLPDVAYPLAEMAGAVTLDTFAVETSAPNMLALLVPSIVGRGESAWGALVSRSIVCMGRCIWIAHFTDAALPRQAHSTAPPMGDSVEWRARVRAASAIPWRGQPVTAPVPPREGWDDPVLDKAIARGGVEWTTILYDSPAIARILLAPMTDAQAVALSESQDIHFLLAFVNTLIEISGTFGWWIDVTHKRSITEGEATISAMVNSVPQAYAKLVKHMAPFFTMPVTNAAQYNVFQELVITLQSKFYRDLLAITGWTRLLDILLDAGLSPNQKAGKGHEASVLQRQRALAATIKPSPIPTSANRTVLSNPLNRSFTNWVEEIVALRILGDIERIYRWRFLVHG